jgi:hypothetical protein
VGEKLALKGQPAGTLACLNALQVSAIVLISDYAKFTPRQWCWIGDKREPWLLRRPFESGSVLNELTIEGVNPITDSDSLLDAAPL